jgi:hypothetical protein
MTTMKLNHSSLSLEKQKEIALIIADNATQLYIGKEYAKYQGDLAGGLVSLVTGVALETTITYGILSVCTGGISDLILTVLEVASATISTAIGDHLELCVSHHITMRCGRSLWNLAKESATKLQTAQEV